MKAIKLVRTRQGCSFLEKKDRYHVYLDGLYWGELYFNMRGYTGCYLPVPPTESRPTTGNLDIGEKGIGEYKREIARLNREWKAYRTA